LEILQLNEENRAKFFTPSFLENLKEKKKIYMLKRNLLEEKSKKKKSKTKKLLPKCYCFVQRSYLFRDARIPPGP